MQLRHARNLFTKSRNPIGFNAEEDEKLSDFDIRFHIILRQHLTILAGWSGFNIIGNLIALLFWHGLFYYFWFMGCVWGIINFGVTIGFFYHTLYRKFRAVGSFKRFMIQIHVEQMMFLNIGIDAAFIFIGFLLREHSFIYAEKRPELWLGFGYAIVVQGFFLIIHDIIFLCLYRRNFQKIQPYLENLMKDK